MFLTRPRAPVHQNLVTKDPVAALHVARHDLRFACCDACGFIFNRDFDPSKLSYGAAYDNTQSYSPHFRRYVEKLIDYLVATKGLRNSRIIEVGCGKGHFLRRLVEQDTANTGWGFDPAYVGPDVDLDGRLRFERRLYGPDCAGVPADAVVCRHVIEHVPDPRALVRAIRHALSASTRAQVFFETPCVEWILRNRVLWDFFYEHSSLFARRSLRTLFESEGFRVERVRHVFGGQYLWLEAIPAEGVRITRRSGHIPRLAKQFGATEERLRVAWQTMVRDLAERERLAIWGAGAKGATFAHLVDPHRELVTCVVDLNPHKQGGYLPGTGHPIVDYRALADLGVTAAILMNPNYREENRALLQQAGLAVRLVELHHNGDSRSRVVERLSPGEDGRK